MASFSFKMLSSFFFFVKATFAEHEAQSLFSTTFIFEETQTIITSNLQKELRH